MSLRLLSHNLRFLREKAGFTQEEVSRKLNISRQTYCNYENVLREPNLDILIQISKILNVSLDTLLLDTTLTYKQEQLWKLNENI